MKKLAVIYHSAHGHTEHIAQHVADGANGVTGTDVHLLKAEQVGKAPEDLLSFDGIIFGSPTYLGGVSGTSNTVASPTTRQPTGSDPGRA